MFQAVSLISKSISVCFDHVLPERFWSEAMIIQNSNWLGDHAAISETHCLFCKLCKALFNSGNVSWIIFFSGKYPHIFTNASHIKQSNYVFNDFNSVIFLQQTMADNMHAVCSKVAHPFKIGPFLKSLFLVEATGICRASRCFISISWFMLTELWLMSIEVTRN